VIIEQSSACQEFLMINELTSAVSILLVAPGRQKSGLLLHMPGSLWWSGTVQAKHNVSTLTTPADVYLRMLTCECMLIFTVVKADHALVLQGQKCRSMCVDALNWIENKEVCSEIRPPA